MSYILVTLEVNYIPKFSSPAQYTGSPSITIQGAVVVGGALVIVGALVELQLSGL